MTKRKIEYWVIPPEQDGEFVACMEEVLETYAQAYDRQHGRATGPVTQGNAGADRRHERTWQACRLRIRTQRHGEHLHVRRTALGFPPGDGPGAADEGGL